jgi:hypothetical protein
MLGGHTMLPPAPLLAVELMPEVVLEELVAWAPVPCDEEDVLPPVALAPPEPEHAPSAKRATTAEGARIAACNAERGPREREIAACLQGLYEPGRMKDKVVMLGLVSDASERRGT